MNTIDRINKIVERRKILDTQQKDIEREKAKTIADLKNGIKSLAPRIKELITVGEILLENNISFGNRVGFRREYEEFITNGITHELGFFFKFGKHNSPLLGIGIKGGGCDGHDLAVNIYGEIVINIDPYAKGYNYDGYYDYCRKYKQFINDFDEFESKFYQYVENL